MPRTSLRETSGVGSASSDSPSRKSDRAISSAWSGFPSVRSATIAAKRAPTLAWSCPRSICPARRRRGRAARCPRSSFSAPSAASFLHVARGRDGRRAVGGEDPHAQLRQRRGHEAQQRDRVGVCDLEIVEQDRCRFGARQFESASAPRRPEGREAPGIGRRRPSRTPGRVVWLGAQRRVEVESLEGLEPRVERVALGVDPPAAPQHQEAQRVRPRLDLHQRSRLADSGRPVQQRDSADSARDLLELLVQRSQNFGSGPRRRCPSRPRS